MRHEVVRTLAGGVTSRRVQLTGGVQGVPAALQIDLAQVPDGGWTVTSQDDVRGA